MNFGPIARTATLSLLLALAAPGPVTAEVNPQPLDSAGLRTLLDQQAGRVVLLNFWATWCRPCLEEIPALQELEARYDKSEFVLVAVSLDDLATAHDQVAGFIAKWFPGFSSWLSAEPDMDALVSVVDPAWNEVLPTSYVIDRDGRVVRRLQGGKPAEEFDAAVAAALQR